MRQTLAFCLLVTSFATVHAAQPELTRSAPEAAESAGSRVDFNQILLDVEALSGARAIHRGLSIKDRALPQNRVIVRSFLIARLRELGLQVSIEEFQLKHERWNVSGEGAPQNLIAEIRGSENPEEVLEVVAHYDTIFENVGGADDNGSGLATVLETARIMSRLNPKRTVRFVFTDLEEPDEHENAFLGATAHVLGLIERREKILGAVIVDMIGHHPVDGPQQVDFEVGLLAQNRKLGEAFYKQHARNDVRRAKLDILTHDAKPTWGEHGIYWNKGIPAIFVSEDFDNFNPAYHAPEDTMENLSLDYFHSVVYSVVEGVAAIAGVESRPGVETYAPGAVRVEHPDLGKFNELTDLGPRRISTTSSRVHLPRPMRTLQ